MVGHIILKRGIKRAAGWASVVTSPFVSDASAGAACILMYHRTAAIDFVDPRTDDWNVPPDVFECHMRTLAAIADVVPLHALRERQVLGPHAGQMSGQSSGHSSDRASSQLSDKPSGAATGQTNGATTAQANGAANANANGAGNDEANGRASGKPLVCVTLDDGYASACESALPILERYGIPATFFVAAAYVGSREPMPFDRWGRLNCGRVGAESWRAAGWRELDRAIRGGLITIGSHSFRHLEGRDCGASHLREEAERSRDTLRARLGEDHARAYAYPYGSSRLGDVTDAYEDAVRGAGYDLAVTTDLGLAHATDNPFRLPRIEAHQVDSASVLRAKLHGALAPYRVTDRLRTAVH
jgi:peptidoglycan/xylan/chitin deacetylase (PgdA/CDA1 family)